jgi:hypothetical protein
MRLPRESLLLLVLATALCLLVGMLAGIRMNALGVKLLVASPTAPPSATPGPTPRPAGSTAAPLLQLSPTAGQVAVLFVGVDNAGAMQPRLESCWIVAFTPGIDQYYILSIPPETRFYLNSLGGQQPLADIYTQDVQQAVGYRFLRDAIGSLLPGMTIQATVTLDRADLADLATKVGGLSVGGHVLVGPALLTAYDSESFNGNAARLVFQHHAIEALFGALASQYWTPGSLVQYLVDLPNAVRPEDAAVLIQLANSAPALQSSELTWNAVGNVREAATVP